MKEIIIERAKPEDAEEMVRVHAQSWMETYPNESAGITEDMIRGRMYGQNNEKLRERVGRYKKSIATQDHTHTAFVVRQSGKIVGLSLPHVEKDGRHRLGAFYLLREVWGKGIGSQLMEKVLEWHGQNDIYLMVTSYNNRAIKFYEKLGFERTGNHSEISVSEKNNDIKMPEVEMVRYQLKTN